VHYNGTTFYYSGNDEFDINHCHGVGFLIKDLLKKYVKNVWFVSTEMDSLLKRNNNISAG